MFVKASISLTQIGALMRENPNLVKKVQFKDGHEEQMLDIVISNRKNDPEQVNISCKPKEEAFDVKWYVGKGKQFEQTQQAQPSAPQPQPSADSSALPF